MHGRLPPRLVSAPLLALAALAGCAKEAPTPPPPAEAVNRFDPASAGAVSGRVTWAGPVPVVPPFRHLPGLQPPPAGPRPSWPNPHAPRIDPATRGVAGAVVFLHRVDPLRARPWDHPPVRVVLRDYQAHVLQGGADRHTGFVRRGEFVEMVSEQGVFHSLQARGAAFFTRALPDPCRPSRQRLDRSGEVELSSGAGYFWMRAHLFIDDHPYYAHTDDTGRFTLAQVPPGVYDLVCWLPDWRPAGHELDGDTARVWRLFFRPPCRLVRRVHVPPRGTAAADFTASAPADRP